MTAVADRFSLIRRRASYPSFYRDPRATARAFFGPGLGWMLVSGLLDLVLAVDPARRLPGKRPGVGFSGVLLGVNMIVGGAAPALYVPAGALTRNLFPLLMEARLWVNTKVAAFACACRISR